MQSLKKLWNDEAGLVLSAELMFVTSIAAIGMIVGLSAARDGVSSELADVGGAINEYNQSYVIASIVGHGAAVSGTAYVDDFDYCDDADDVANADQACIVRALPGVNETGANPAPSVIP